MQKEFPKISIVTPCAGMEATIETTIKSIVDQGYPNLEYIVLDAAKDDTRRILERYDSQISFWRSEPDAGQYEAIVEGFEMATGSIYFWLNADDILLPGSLFTVAEIFTSFPEIEWISSLTPLILDAKGRLAMGDRIPGFSREALLDGLYVGGVTPTSRFIQQESTFFTSSLWKRSGKVLAKNGVAGDFALWAEFYKTAELVGVNAPLGAFRIRNGQRSEGDAYKNCAEGILKRVREENNWNDSLKNRLRYAMLAEAPGIRGALLRTIPYSGTIIKHEEIGRADAGWIKKAHKFLPRF